MTKDDIQERIEALETELKTLRDVMSDTGAPVWGGLGAKLAVGGPDFKPYSDGLAGWTRHEIIEGMNIEVRVIPTQPIVADQPVRFHATVFVDRVPITGDTGDSAQIATDKVYDYWMKWLLRIARVHQTVNSRRTTL